MLQQPPERLEPEQEPGQVSNEAQDQNPSENEAAPGPDELAAGKGQGKGKGAIYEAINRMTSFEMQEDW